MLLPMLPVQTKAPESTVIGRLEILPFASKVLGNERKVRVWLPEGYRRGDGLLLMHDGQNLFDGATSYIPGGEWRVDETATASIRAGLMPRVVIVGIDNAGADRAAEYLPKAFKMRNGQEIGGRADRYLRMISEELLPMLATKYGTPTKGIGMIGSSLGGIITLYAGLKEPQRYTRLGIVSPSVWIDERAPLGWPKRLSKRPRAWIDIGLEEGNESMNARALHDRFRASGWTTSEVTYYEEPRAEHNEGAWARRLPTMLAWLYRR